MSNRKKENPEPEPAVKMESLGATQGEAGDESGGIRKHRVSIKSKRVNLLDPDNLVGGCKHLIDSLRLAGIIPEDTPEALELSVSQEKVSSYRDEETQVEVEA